MTSATKDEQRLREELDAAGIRYGIRFTEQGTPYASFGISAESSADDAMLTATVQGNTLSLTAHALLKRRNSKGGDAGLFNQVNRAWPLGCVYYDDVDGSWAARVAMPLSTAGAVGETLLVYLNHLHASLPAVRRFDFPRVELPTADPPVSLREVESMFAMQGTLAQLIQDGDLLQGPVASAQHSFHLQIFVMPGSVLVLRGRHADVRVVEAREIKIAVSTANARLAAAKLMLWPGKGQIYTEVSVPLAACPLTRELIDWCLSHITHALLDARRIESSPDAQHY